MTAQAPTSLPSPWPMFRAMVGVGLACGLGIVGMFLATRGTIERNRAEALRAAIFQVLPTAHSHETFVWNDDSGFAPATPEASGPQVYAAYGEQGQLVGLALEDAGMGYQDVIRVLYGYALDAQAIVGLAVLESRETPGLGDRIETDPAFRANFERLDATLSPDGASLANAIVAVKNGEKQHPWQIDGITGATISAEAIAAILHRSASAWAPRVQQRRGDFAGAGTGHDAD